MASRIQRSGKAGMSAGAPMPMALAEAKPILFSGAMVRAIMDGRKTQTRRIAREPWMVRLPRDVRGDGPFRETVAPAGVYAAQHNDYGAVSVVAQNGKLLGVKPKEFELVTPYGQPGGLLWVREAFRVTEAFESVYYRADDPDPDGDKWRPSIHMPRWAARLYLRLESVRVERLQDISDSDCYAEGVRLASSGVFPPAYRQDFYDLWQRINGKRAPWADNPFVFVLTFSKV